MTRSEHAAAKFDRWHGNGQAYGARPAIALSPGSDDAKVRLALRQLDYDRGVLDDRGARRAFAAGVRAKLAQYRAAGVIA